MNASPFQQVNKINVPENTPDLIKVFKELEKQTQLVKGLETYILDMHNDLLNKLRSSDKVVDRRHLNGTNNRYINSLSSQVDRRVQEAVKENPQFKENLTVLAALANTNLPALKNSIKRLKAQGLY